MELRLETERLTLRLFELADADTVQRLAGDEQVVHTTLNIPHPYPDGAAEEWIEHTHSAFRKGEICTLALVRKADQALIGCVSLRISRGGREAELGYWVGRPYRGQGYCTEAAREAVRYGFGALDLDHIHAAAMKSNPASWKVMRKIGMKPEEREPRHIIKSGVTVELVHYGIGRSDVVKP
jgi:RimJ/RimL family protein N-acetyltransferase